MKKIIFILFAYLGFIACDKKEVLPDQSQLDVSDPVLNSTDQWIRDNLTTPYNIDVRYKWNEFNLSDMGKYNYPTTIDHANRMARLLKHTWLDAYVDVAGSDFVKKNAPRQFTLFGGEDRTPSGGPGAWGQAAGGVNVLLFSVSNLTENDLSSPASLQRYSELMHHEYTHILNQNVPFDEENFQKITPEGYTAQFQLIPETVSRQEGFISSYARMNIMEDFAEMVSTMLARSREEWDAYVNQEVARFTAQRNDFLNGFEDVTRERAAMRATIANAKKVIDSLSAALAAAPNQFVTPEEQAAYRNAVGLPIRQAAAPIMNFMFDNWRIEADAGNTGLYDLLVLIFEDWNSPNFTTSPTILRRFLATFTPAVLPYFENRYSAANDFVSLSDISANLEKATRGRDKIREKERFVVAYFRSKLNIDIYQLQSATYNKLSTPIGSAVASNRLQSVSNAAASSNAGETLVPHGEVRQLLKRDECRICSWQKQQGKTGHQH